MFIESNDVRYSSTDVVSHDEHVFRPTAVASFSHRLLDADQQVVLGGKGAYEPLCRECFSDLRLAY